MLVSLFGAFMRRGIMSRMLRRPRFLISPHMTARHRHHVLEVVVGRKQRTYGYSKSQLDGIKMGFAHYYPFVFPDVPESHAKLERIPNTTAVVFSNGTDAMVSASF